MQRWGWPRPGRDSTTTRRANGWPACPDGAKANPERLSTKAALETLMGDDEDGLAATFADYHL